MTAALIVFATFAGLAWVVGAVGACIMLGRGQITLPNTNARRLMREKTDAEVAKIKLEKERTLTMIDAQIDLRHKQLTDGQGHR